MREARRGGCFACGRNDGGRGKGSTSYRYKNIGRRYRQEIQARDTGNKIYAGDYRQYDYRQARQAREYRQENTGKRIQAREYRQENIGKRICDGPEKY